MKITCDRCNTTFDDLFATEVRFDYVEPGKGKPYKGYLCLTCRKELMDWLKYKGQ